MNSLINPKFKNELQMFGIKSKDWNDCFHCGNCTAICPLTEDGSLFPRKGIRSLQMGLKKKITRSLEPWLCYYCGECSETCPRGANPGELLMSLRRYLTKVYDWTGLSGLFYSSFTALVIALILVAAAVIGIAYKMNFDTHPIMEFGHTFEKLAILMVAAVIILPNIFRMFWLSIIKEKVKAPLFAYIKGFFNLILHMFLQKKSLKCGKHNFRWFEHFLVVIGYIVLLITTVFLNWFSSENYTIILLGYMVGGITFIFTFHFILGRIGKTKEVNKFSHPTDWIFVIWLFLMGLTAVIVRILIDINMIENYLWLYLIHIIILAQWAILIVPFGKWMHFLYRSFAVYFDGIKRAAIKRNDKKELLKSAA